MNDFKVLCSISTRGRYDTTLPIAIQSVMMQTRKPDKLIIFDDNDQPLDLREIQVYRYLFMMLQLKGIDWEIKFGERKGQHFNHQQANKMSDYDFVWRMDDDTVAEHDTLEKLLSHVDSTVGAIGGAVLTPPFAKIPPTITGKIENINIEPNIQWDYIDSVREVDHLHCSFLYRSGIVDYNLSLSRIAHREETLFTYELKLAGYKILAIPAVTWHLKNQVGGIRDGIREMFDHDDNIFQNFLFEKLSKSNTIVVLDCGMGDHIVFKKILPLIKNPMIFSCYPEIIPGRSILEAKQLFGANIDRLNIYQSMDQWKWKDSLESAFRKLYIESN